ncbi:MAG: hypothetical protein CBC09_09050 [Cellvibrionales bacterium TMED49]|nr:MAG: hypothetical protein CBC09_09050 [Cellvibrionales bacterium TMED49]
MREFKGIALYSSLNSNSPCIKQCDLNQKLEICNSCKRTIQEIRDWSKMSEQKKLLVLQRIKDLV